MTLPNFLIIGSQKAATTSLHRYLDQHPQVYMSPVKEPNFFSIKPDFSIDVKKWPWTRGWVSTREEYERLFDGVNGELAIGEASTNYLGLPHVPANIHALLPHAKLIAVLRHPVDRAYSHFLYHRKQMWETEADFERAIERERRLDQPHRWPPRVARYLPKGRYHQLLSAYYDLFPREQIRVFLFEDFLNDPRAMIHRIFEFLGVDPDFEPDMSIQHNISGQPRNRLVALALQHGMPARRVLEKVLPPAMVNRVGRMLLRPAALEPRVRAALIEEYRPDIMKLQELIGRDLSHWLK